MPTDFSSLSRPIQPMAGDIRQALEEWNLMDRYHARPPYQQNDYLRWIERAKRPATRLKRLTQMLEELLAGDKYMKMDWRGN